jgi:hypothetical protein
MRGLFGIALILLGLTYSDHVLAEQTHTNSAIIQKNHFIRKRINFIFTRGKERTPTPAGWEEYDGSVYTRERGYGWLTDLTGSGSDGGGVGKMILADGRKVSPVELGRLELANWQGTHQENRLLVFRVDLDDGWYQVTCASVDPDNAPLPLVDQRNIKFRAHDVVFAGPSFGAPLKIEGNRLVEGSGIVEVTDGHLRIVVGDPAYGGWTWSYKGPFWRGWKRWWKHPSVFANNWYQKITRFVDPGFHSLRFNSLEIEPVGVPAKQPKLIFRDFFNREDSSEMNLGVPNRNHWVRVKQHAADSDRISADLYKTSLRLTGSKKAKASAGITQAWPSPEKGTIRYSTRVSLFTGEGSKIHSGSQEAGLLILAQAAGAAEFSSTFIGLAFDRSRAETPGWVRYRVGNGRDGYRTNSEIPDISLPFRLTEGEYEIIVDHDVKTNFLQRIQINGKDITQSFTPADRKQVIPRGLFGIHSSMDPLGSGVSLQQFYWYYRVEDISSRR